MAKELVDREANITYKDLTFTGCSWSGYQTYIILKSHNLVFDLGACTHAAASCQTVLLSHIHQDHAAGMTKHLALRKMTGQRTSRFYLPTEQVNDARQILQLWDKAEGRERFNDDILCGVADGDRFPLRKGLEVEVFEVKHTITSVGYRLMQHKHVLKDEYHGLSGPEIGELVRSGAQVKREVIEPFVTYFGDTTTETLDARPDLLTGKIIILECTFLDPKDHPLAAPRGHLHLQDIADRHHLFDCELLILKHFSLKYSPREIKEKVDAGLPSPLLQRTQLLL